LSNTGLPHRARFPPYRSPLSPWPGFALAFALRLRSCERDFPTSSDSLNCTFRVAADESFVAASVDQLPRRCLPALRRLRCLLGHGCLRRTACTPDAVDSPDVREGQGEVHSADALLKTDSLPNDPRWRYELKLDGYRTIAFKSGGKLHLRSRNDKDFSQRYPDVIEGLAKLPDETVIDGEVVAFDKDGRPSFNALQNYGSARAPVVYYVFDLMILAGVDVRREALEKCRQLLEKKVLPKLSEPVRHTATLDAPLPALIESVKAQGLEGLVAKRLDSKYEAGLRSGAWQKMRVNRGQEFVIGGYTRGTKTFDGIVFESAKSRKRPIE
jgi:ATP dependent DNA ligase domain